MEELKKQIFELKSYDVKDKFGNIVMVVSLTKIYKIIDEVKKDFDNIYKEIEMNATEDTLFERVVLVRLRRYRKTWFGEK